MLMSINILLLLIYLSGLILLILALNWQKKIQTGTKTQSYQQNRAPRLIYWSYSLFALTFYISGLVLLQLIG